MHSPWAQHCSLRFWACAGETLHSSWASGLESSQTAWPKSKHDSVSEEFHCMWEPPHHWHKSLRFMRFVSSWFQRCPKMVISATGESVHSQERILSGNHHSTNVCGGLWAHLGTPPNTTIVAAEGDTLVLDHNIPQVLVGLADVHTLDGLGGLTGVLVKQSNHN